MTITPDVRRQYFDPAAEQQERVIRLEPSSVRPLGPTRRAGTPWTDDEHERFLQGLEMFPRGPWKRIAEHVATRTTRQTMTHAQKYRQKIARFREGRDLQSIAQRRQHRDDRLRRRNRSAREAKEYQRQEDGEHQPQRRQAEEEESGDENENNNDNDDERLLYELPVPETPRATTQASRRPKPRQSPRLEREVARPPTATATPAMTTTRSTHALPRRMHTPTHRPLIHHSSSSISMEHTLFLGHHSPFHYHHHPHAPVPISGAGGGTTSSNHSSSSSGGRGSGSIGVASRPQAAELAAVEWLLQELKPVHFSRLDTELEMTLHSAPEPRSRESTTPRFVFPPGPPTS
ncbi:hypothetical protein PINS_up000854 [Pythium insidiosum]|nr:hypothetical protein PINS_up000854 [Pythium insidiosum]